MYDEIRYYFHIHTLLYFLFLACNCYPAGTLVIGDISCDPNNGQCACLDHVEGLKCDTCQAGYWNIDSGTGE